MSEPTVPEPDRAPGAPHPRETMALVGQGAAEHAFLDAYASGRLHHAWLITGPRGVGKATLAWRIARFLLTQPASSDGGLFGEAPPPPGSLDVPADHPVVRRLLAGSEPRLAIVRRSANERTGRLSAEIRVEDVRRLKEFFALSAADGGHRVVIIDAADEMNVSAANAILKLLEEPPANCTLLLVSHQPARLLPTIRSRCRALPCPALGPEDLSRALVNAGADLPENTLALAELAGGSVGDALRLLGLDGQETYSALIDLFNAAPGVDRSAAIKIADSAAGRGREDHFALLLDLIDLFLARAARLGATGTAASEAAAGEAALLARLSPTPAAARRWARLQQELSARARHGQAVNLDPSGLILDMILKIDEAAGRHVAA